MKLSAALKRVDGFFASYLTRWFSLPVVWVASKIGLSPHVLSFISLAFGLWAAWAFFLNKLIWGAILVQISFVFDCADGQLARYTGQMSKFGAWLDTMIDRLKEFFCLFALASVSGYYWLGFYAILVSALRHYDFAKRKELGITLEKERQEEKATVLAGWPRFKAIIKESLLFGISERWAVITIFTLFGWLKALFIFLIIVEGLILIIKSTYTWRKKLSSLA